MNEELKKALEELRAAIGAGDVQSRARLDKIDKLAGERDADTKTLRAELDQIKKDAETRENTIKDLQQRQRQQNMQRDPIRDRREALRMFGMQARAALCAFLRTALPKQFLGEREQVKQYAERMAERATLSELTGDGTVFVPTILASDMFFEALEEVQNTIARTEFLPGFPTKATIPYLSGRPTLQSKRASTDTAMTQSDPGFGSMSIDTEEVYTFFPVDNNLLNMAPMMLGNMLLPLCRDSILDGLDNWLINADGTAAYNSLTGIFNESTAAYIDTLPNGKTAFVDADFRAIRGLKSGVFARGRARGVYLMSDGVLANCEDIEREGKLPLVTYPGDGSTPRIAGKEVVIDEWAPDVTGAAAGKGIMGFGDLKTYVVALAGDGITVAASSEYLFGKNQTCFRATAHADIKRKPVNTFRLLKTAAA